jgi:glycosyltransferase involved in cell wall biosynthesis
VEDSAATKTGVSVVIPVYNSEEILPALLERLATVLPQAATCYEVILVNDGSRDNSWTRIQELAARYSFVRGFELMRNFGQHNALLAGVRAAHFDVVVTMDDDLQHPPEEIGKLVYGVPEVLPHSHGRNLASRLTKLVLQKAMGAEIASRVDAFRAFRTQLREAFANFMGVYISLDVLLTWGTSRFGMVTVDHHARRVGESNYNFRKLMTHALNMMTGFSPLPLQLASLLGFGTTAFGVLVLAYVLIRAFVQKGAPPGFPLLVSIISIFSGAQLVALGIIGEYLARVHARSLDRPPYVVRGRTP